jgi:hypothetical protein
MADNGYTPKAWIHDETTKAVEGDEDRAEQDRYVAGRADIWHAARAMLFKAGELDPQPEHVVDLARFLAGDGVGGY